MSTFVFGKILSHAKIDSFSGSYCFTSDRGQRLFSAWSAYWSTLWRSFWSSLPNRRWCKPSDCGRVSLWRQKILRFDTQKGVMFRVVFENPFFRFLVTSIGLYLGWYCLYEFYLHTQTSFDKVVIDGLVRWAEFTLQALGYTTTDYSTADVIFREHIGIAGSKGVTIGAPCDGVVLYALFVFFVAAFPGPWKH